MNARLILITALALLATCQASLNSRPTASPLPSPQEKGEEASPRISFSDYFEDKTMRMDFYHCGNADEEMYFFDELKEEPYFAGSYVSLRDSFDYGNQRFVLLDKETGVEIYSFHYCTLWGEWQCTPEAKTTSLGMPESIVFPYPKRDAIAQIWSRGNPHDPRFHDLQTVVPWELKFEYEIKADNYFVRGFSKLYDTEDVHVVGDPHTCLDIVLIPEGYTEGEREQFVRDCQFFASEFFSFEPWSSNEQRVNMRLVWAPSAESGVSIPAIGKWRSTAIKANYFTFDSERYQMTYDFQAVRDIAGHAPYDYIYILTNSDKYGGGGIYNFYGIGAGHEARGTSGRVHVHEFGHQMLGLGDEYVEIGNTTSDQYDPAVEPWEANLTTKVDVSRKPWAYALMPSDSIHGNTLPEGGGYLEHGIWRPYEHCLMNTLAYGFCPVCLQAVTDYLDYITR